MNLTFRFSATILLFASASVSAVDYKSDVLPIMKEHCWECHSNEHKVKGNLALDDFDEVRDYQVGEYNIIQPGKPDTSNFLERLLLESSHTDFMPRKAEPLPKEEIEIIEAWIQAGAVIDAKNPSEGEKKWVSSDAGRGKAIMKDAKSDFHVWTNSQGKEIEARFLSLDGENVRILLKNGKQYSFPLSKLSEESAAQAKSLSGK